MSTTSIITKSDLLKHWQGHRILTRKTIEAFPEKDLFEFRIGNLRPFADMVKEMFAIAVPGLKGIVNNSLETYNHDLSYTTKEELLKRWDEDTPHIEKLYNLISENRFSEEFNLFGEYKFPIVENIQYFIDNEIHHRAQAYVYLRALNIEPPFFWERY